MEFEQRLATLRAHAPEPVFPLDLKIYLKQMSG